MSKTHSILALGPGAHLFLGKEIETSPAAEGDDRGILSPEVPPQRPDQPGKVSQGLLHGQQLCVPAPCGLLAEWQRLSVVAL